MGSVAAGVYALARQATNRLAELGIKSGFTFLGETAGFNIGERLPIPRLEAGLLSFTAAVFIAALGVWLLSKWAQAKGGTIGGDTRLAVIRVALLFGVPGLVLYATGETIQADDFTAESTFREALVVGIFNTFRVSVLGIVDLPAVMVRRRGIPRHTWR